MRSEPLVSCIMPTRGRPELARRALDCFAARTYWNAEMVIVDDFDARSFAEGEEPVVGVHYNAFFPARCAPMEYCAMPTRLSIGGKRNIACSRAQGEIICHWDDDDLSAPGRIADQVARLLETGAQVTGYGQMEFVEPDGTRWMYSAPEGWDDYAIGTSLMYRRDYWKAHPFETVEIKDGDEIQQEDNHFVWAARKAGAIVSVPARGLMTATIHPGNTSFRQLGPGQKNYVRVA